MFLIHNTRTCTEVYRRFRLGHHPDS